MIAACLVNVEYEIFETSLGPCGIAWTYGSGPAPSPAVVGFQLPEATTELTEARIAQRSGGRKSNDAPTWTTQIIRRVCRHLEGNLQDFRDVEIDLEMAGSFARKVYQAAREIPPGQTRTYGELARLLNKPNAARAVGQALGNNPIALIVPCHRVVAAGGKPGGFTAHGGWATKQRMLAIEGCYIESGDAPTLLATR